MRKQQKKCFRDRKKKKFVGKEDKEKSKKIRTESGILIPASYKSDLYAKWKKRQRIEATEDGNDTERPQRFGFNRSARRGKNRSELKGKEQILKERRRKEKMQSLQKRREHSKKKRGQTNIRRGRRGRM